MIHQLVIILLLSQSTSSTARHAMEDLRIIAANALVKNIGRAYASLNDVVTPSIVEHVSARVLETTASSIQAAITRIAAQQQSFQEVTETRLAVLRSNIDGFFKSIPESNNTHIQNASVSPCVGVELDKLTPTRLSPSFSSAPEQSLQICSQVNKYDIPEQFCAARRTLGFFPVALKQSQFPSGLTNVTEDLQKYLIIFMKDYLQMDSSKIEQLIIEDIWYNSKAKALDIYLRGLSCGEWTSQQATTQFQGQKMSHELASLLLTETIVNSDNVSKRPVFALFLDARAAFNRVVRKILVRNLFAAGIHDQRLVYFDKRLGSRYTYCEYDKELMGPILDLRGLEQGGVSSSELYKLYNNEQANVAQASRLGVPLVCSKESVKPVHLQLTSSPTISCISLADDAVLLANTPVDLSNLLMLTNQYC